MVRKILLPILFLVANRLAADEVYLQNGDRLQGTLCSIQHDSIKLKTEYAGTVTIKLSHVTEMLTVSSKVWLLPDKTRFYARLKWSRNSKARLCNESDEVLKELPVTGLVGPYKDEKALVAAQTPAKKKNWTFQLTTGLSYLSGNTEKETLHFDGRVNNKADKHHLDLRLRYTESEAQEEVTERRARFAGTWKQDLLCRTYWFLNDETQYDEFRNLNLRTVNGSGLGWRLFENKHFTMELGTGLSHILERFANQEDNASFHLRGRAMAKLKLNKRLTLSNEYIIYPDMETSSYLFNNESRIHFALDKHWGITFSHEIDCDSDPAPDVVEADRKTHMGLTFRF